MHQLYHVMSSGIWNKTMSETPPWCRKVLLHSQVNTAPKLVLLDVGMVAELTPEDQHNLVGFFKVSITCSPLAHHLCTCFLLESGMH